MIKGKLVFFDTEAHYNSNKSNINDQQIIFIKDTQKIITHGTTFDGSPHKDLSGYLKTSGGTLTGPLILKGSAASNPLTTRGIRGSDGNGNAGDLYLNLNKSGKTYFGGTTYCISEDGSNYNGRANSADLLNNVIKVNTQEDDNNTVRKIWMGWKANINKATYSDDFYYKAKSKTLYVGGNAVSIQGHTHNTLHNAFVTTNNKANYWSKIASITFNSVYKSKNSILCLLKVYTTSKSSKFAFISITAQQQAALGSSPNISLICFGDIDKNNLKGILNLSSTKNTLDVYIKLDLTYMGYSITILSGDDVRSVGTLLQSLPSGTVLDFNYGCTVLQAELADKLKTSRSIWGLNFDGTTNITENTILGAKTVGHITDSNHRLYLGWAGKDYVDWVEYGGVWRFKSGSAGKTIDVIFDKGNVKAREEIYAKNDKKVYHQGNLSPVTLDTVLTITGSKTFNDLVTISDEDHVTPTLYLKRPSLIGWQIKTGGSGDACFYIGTVDKDGNNFSTKLKLIHNGSTLSGPTLFSGNASTASKLKTPVTINGVSFDGSESITINSGSIAYTALTGSLLDKANQAIVSNGKKDGWQLKQLGSRAFDSTAYLPLAGGTMTGDLKLSPNTYIYGKDEPGGAVVFFNGSKTIIGSMGASTTTYTHIRSKDGHVTTGTDNNVKYTLWDSGNFDPNDKVRDWGTSSGSLDDIAKGGRSSMGMVNLTTEGPGKNKSWHHFINISYVDGGTGSNSWITQLANKAGTNNLYIRSRDGGTIGSKAWTSDWNRILLDKDLSNYYTKPDINTKLAGYLPLSGGTLTGTISFPLGKGIYCTDGDGWTLLNQLSNGTHIGSGVGTTFIRSGLNDLVHKRTDENYKETNYKIWDEYNLTPSNYATKDYAKDIGYYRFRGSFNNLDAFVKDRATGAYQVQKTGYGAGLFRFAGENASVSGMEILANHYSFGEDPNLLKVRLEIDRNRYTGWQTFWTNANFNPANYLPLSGGKMTGNLHISGTSTGDMSITSTNPQIEFSHSGTLNLKLIYTAVDAYRPPAGLKVVSNADGKDPWFECQGEMYANGGHKVYHEGNFNPDNICKTWKAVTRVNQWRTIAKLTYDSSLLLTIKFTQNSQSSSHTYLVNTGYATARIIQLSYNGFNVHDEIPVQVTSTSATQFLISVYLTYGYNGASVVDVMCKAFMLSTMYSPIEPITTETVTTGSSVFSLTSNYNYAVNFNADMVDGHHASDFLLKSGGTIDSNTTYPLKIKGAVKYSVLNYLNRDDNPVADIGWLNDGRGNHAYVANISSNGVISVNNNGAYYSNDTNNFTKYTIWHSGNFAPGVQRRYWNIDTSGLSSSNFYPVFFYGSNWELDCEIHSPCLGGGDPYNLNCMHFLMTSFGWSDTPFSFKILSYGLYDWNEVTIGAIGRGDQTGGQCVWVRGGRLYQFLCNREPILRTSNWTYGTETYTVGTSYNGSGSNPNVSTIWLTLLVSAMVATQGLLAGYLPLSGGTINANNKKAPLILKGGLSGYREGLRILPYNGWSDILLAGSDASEASGTSANSWFIGNNNGNFYFNRNGSSEHTGYELCNIGGNWGIGTVAPSYKLDVVGNIRADGWIRSLGDCGFYFETHGGGWHMKDLYWLRTWNNKTILSEIAGGINGWGLGGHTLNMALYSHHHSSIILSNHSCGWGICSNANGNMYIGKRFNSSLSSASGDKYIAVLTQNGLEVTGTINTSSTITGTTLFASSGAILGFSPYTHKSVISFGWSEQLGDHLLYRIPGTNDQSVWMRISANQGFYMNRHLQVNGNITATMEVTAYSDARLKSNIKPLENRGAITPVTYMKDGKLSIGFLAQDVRKVYPELVSGEESEDSYLSLNYSLYTAVLQAQIIELQNKIKELERRIK